MRNAKAVFIIFLYMFFVGNVLATNVHFSGELNPVSDTGYYLLSWDHPQEGVIELQQSLMFDFKEAETLYSGHNDSFFLSGLQNGTYYYRIKADNGVWSDALTLQVKHHSFEKAWLLFAIGIMVFGSIVWVIIRGETHAE